MSEELEELLVKLGRMEDAPLFWISPKVEKSLRENKQLQHENKQLKAKLEMYENGVYYSSENDKLKEVIEEVREYIGDWLFNVSGNGASMTYEDINEILQILDKGVKND